MAGFFHCFDVKGHNLLNYIFTMTHYEQYSYAIKMDMLSDNPCRNVTVPKGESKEKEIYTIDELARIFELLDGDDVPIKFRAFFKLAVYSGFRRGELLGLEWKDVDWENNLISVRRTSNYTAERGTYTDTTKTKKSKRTLKFPDYVMNMLRELKEEQDKEQNKLGNKWTYTDRLFTQWDGKPMGNNSPYYWVKRFCKRNNLRFCDLHSLRHHNNMKTYLLNFEVYKQIYSPAKQPLMCYTKEVVFVLLNRCLQDYHKFFYFIKNLNRSKHVI